MDYISIADNASDLSAKFAPTQPTCDVCYSIVSISDRAAVPVLVSGREIEKCCWCGKKTKAGIYAAVDVNKVKHPTNKFFH